MRKFTSEDDALRCIAELEAAQQWIPYRQSAHSPLPDESQNCWTYYADGVVDQSIFLNGRFPVDNEVLYWMPVIEPPPPGEADESRSD